MYVEIAGDDNLTTKGGDDFQQRSELFEKQVLVPATVNYRLNLKEQVNRNNWQIFASRKLHFVLLSQLRSTFHKQCFFRNILSEWNPLEAFRLLEKNHAVTKGFVLFKMDINSIFYMRCYP